MLPLMTNETDLIGAQEAARLLHVHRSTLTRMVQAGRLPEALKMEGHTGARLFRIADVEALRDELASPSPTEQAAS